jgi:hypothetical protein
MGCGCGGGRSYRRRQDGAAHGPRVRSASTSHKTVPTHQLNAFNVPQVGRESQITQKDRDAVKRRRDLIRRKLGR